MSIETLLHNNFHNERFPEEAVIRTEKLPFGAVFSRFFRRGQLDGYLPFGSGPGFDFRQDNGEPGMFCDPQVSVGPGWKKRAGKWVLSHIIRYNGQGVRGKDQKIIGSADRPDE